FLSFTYEMCRSVFHDATSPRISLGKPCFWRDECDCRCCYLQPMSVSARVRRAAVAAVGAAPPPVKRLVFGAPVRRQELTLHPDMQAMLALMRLENPDPAAPPISRQRPDFARAHPPLRGDQPIGADTERQIPGAGGPIRMRFYTPRDLHGPSPALVWFHGGGFTLGDLASHDSLCRFLAEQAMVRV